MVSELFNNEMDQWKVTELQRLFGSQAAEEIAHNVNKPNRGDAIPDRLIWEQAKSGKYTVKEGYMSSVGTVVGQEELGREIAWLYIWKWRNIEPKIQIFMWRLLSKALPLAQNMHRRINTFSPTCQRCFQENEYEMHCFFFCPGSRMVWFGGSLGIRTHDLPLNIMVAVKLIIDGLDAEGVRIFSHTMWEIWKARNEAVIQHKNFEPGSVCQKVRVAVTGSGMGFAQQITSRHEGWTRQYTFYENGWQVIVDASWDTVGRAGTAHLIYKNGRLQRVGFNTHNMHDSFQAEATALQEAVTHVHSHMIGMPQEKVQFFTDCQTLVKAINDRDIDNLPSWRAMPVLVHTKQTLDQMGDTHTVHHVYREAVGPAHTLANTARRSAAHYQGPVNGALLPTIEIGMSLDMRFFMRVQEAPP